MRNRIRLGSHLITIFIAAASPLLSQETTPDITHLSWMAGNWTGAATGRAVSEEHWIAPAGGAMLGMSRTIARERMVAFEFLRIERRADGIYYVAQPNGRPPTDFKLTKMEAKLAVFENPQHDFPKMITYRIDSDATLVATVEGSGGKKQEFRFTRAAK